MKVVQGGQKRFLSRTVWSNPSLHGKCVILETRTVAVKALGNPPRGFFFFDPPQLYFYLNRKPRRPLLTTILRHDPTKFVSAPALTRSTKGLGDWTRGRKTMKEAAGNQGLPPRLIDDIYPKTGRPDPVNLRRKYPKWPLVGTIRLHIALRQSHGQTSVILLSGSKKKPVAVATAEKPDDPDIYTSPPALVWNSSPGRFRGLLNLDLGQRGLIRNRSEAKRLFHLLGISPTLVDTILNSTLVRS